MLKFIFMLAITFSVQCVSQESKKPEESTEIQLKETLQHTLIDHQLLAGSFGIATSVFGILTIVAILHPAFKDVKVRTAGGLALMGLACLAFKNNEIDKANAIQQIINRNAANAAIA